MYDHSGLPGPTSDNLWADRQRRIGIHHATRHIHSAQRNKRLQILVQRQSRTPIRDTGQSHVRLMYNNGLTRVIHAQIGHFTAPSVNPAIKWRCIRKNIATGGKAATRLPALIK
jgi:hypothetical protein